MMDARALFSANMVVSEKTAAVAELFFSTAAHGARYALGRNEESGTLDKLFGLTAFVDDFAPAGSLYGGKPVIAATDVPRNAIVVNCSASISPVSAHRRLVDSGISQVIDYSSLCWANPARVPLPAFVRDSRADFERNAWKYEELERSLMDSESKRVFSDVLSFRLTGNLESMREYTIRVAEQYFEDFLRLDESVFVDAGGFDGDTTEAFCKRCQTYKKVILFEPSPINLAQARARLAAYRDIEFLPLALSDRTEMLSFNPNSGPMSSVSTGADTHVPATTLDAQVRTLRSALRWISKVGKLKRCMAPGGTSLKTTLLWLSRLIIKLRTFGVSRS